MPKKGKKGRAQDDLSSYEHGEQFVQHARRRGASVRQGGTAHAVVTHGKHTIVVPVGHSKPLGKSLKHALIKAFLAAGLAALLLMWMLPSLL